MIYPVFIFSMLFIMACESAPFDSSQDYQADCIDDGASVQCAQGGPNDK